MTRYREKYGITSGKWDFLTGDEEKTHRLGIENFQLFAGKDPASAGGVCHSPATTLIDEGYVRGVYVGVETEDVDRMAEDVRKLLRHRIWHYWIQIARRQITSLNCSLSFDNQQPLCFG